jgi:probable HAF family extracellular repeat protein
MCSMIHSLLLFGLCFIAVAANAQRYSVTDLGPLSPNGINSWAQVVGNYTGHAYLWTKWNRMRDLGTLPGGTFSMAAAINDLGVVIGNANGPGTIISQNPDFSPAQCSDLNQPFVWTSTAGMKGLGGIAPNPGPPPSFFGCGIPDYATDINALGHVVGFIGAFSDYGYAFSWTQHTGMMSLEGPDYGNWPPTMALGTNNRGQIVGQSASYLLFEVGHATLWNNSDASDLGTLGGGADITEYGSAANDINDRGEIAGWSTTGTVTSEGSPVHAVLWTNAGIRDLGTLPSDTSSAAVKINLFGQVIGTSGDTIYTHTTRWQAGPFQVIGRPFIWTERTGMIDLNTLILQKPGWVLQTATDINLWGQIIGSGTRNGQPHGYLLTPLNPFQVF